MSYIDLHQYIYSHTKVIFYDTKFQMENIIIKIHPYLIVDETD